MTELATYKERIDKLRDDMVRVLYPHLRDAAPPAMAHVLRPERVARQLLSVVTANPYLLECDRASLLGTVVRATELGLELSGPLGHAYPVPYKGKVQLIVGYPGLVELSCRSPAVKGIDAHLVYQGDQFEIDFGNPTRPIVHKPCLDPEKRGETIGAYALAFLKDGVVIPEWMTNEEIDKIKKAALAKTKGKGPWADPASEPEMRRKCPIRRIAKRLPKQTYLQTAIGMEELYDRGGDQRNEMALLAPSDKSSEEQVAYIRSLRSQMTKKLGVPLDLLTVHLRAVLQDEGVAIFWPERDDEAQWFGDNLNKAQAHELIELMIEEKIRAEEESSPPAEEAEIE